MSRHDTDLNLTPELLLRAYAAGIFPMAETRDTSQVYWVDPKHRGVLPIADFHVPRRLRRTVRNSNFEITCNTDFAEVVAMCAQATKGRGDTWINPSIEGAVNELSNMGFAHSVECRQDGELVGGLYGISLGAAFFGESMFSRKRDASKVALVHLVARLNFGGYRLLDTQFITDHLAQFGAVEIPARDYLIKLEDALKYQATFPAFAKGTQWDQCLAKTLSN